MTDRFQIFSNNLKNERLAKGLTQLQISKMLGISQPVYNRYEKGGTRQGREPDFNTLCEIAVILEVSADYLLGLDI